MTGRMSGSGPNAARAGCASGSRITAPLDRGLGEAPEAGPAVDLPARLAVVLGMAFHELATNAAKYGALSTASGRIQVDWTVESRGEEAILTIDWCELDGPALETERRPGFGSRLLRQAITQELAGHLDLRYEREGVCCTIAVPSGSVRHQAA
ncbi:hypothetical protein AB4097_10070 [Microvirga sp. 2MCAF35]|uniref:hypothetical protein n=1 Tax=Microvirga sp. 2MCAF35 TaxID=3232987 RepID=UPI003F9768DC